MNLRESFNLYDFYQEIVNLFSLPQNESVNKTIEVSGGNEFINLYEILNFFGDSPTKPIVTVGDSRSDWYQDDIYICSYNGYNNSCIIYGKNWQNNYNLSDNGRSVKVAIGSRGGTYDFFPLIEIYYGLRYWDKNANNEDIPEKTFKYTIHIIINYEQSFRDKTFTREVNSLDVQHIVEILNANTYKLGDTFGLRVKFLDYNETEKTETNLLKFITFGSFFIAPGLFKLFLDRRPRDIIFDIVLETSNGTFSFTEDDSGDFGLINGWDLRSLGLDDNAFISITCSIQVNRFYICVQEVDNSFVNLENLNLAPYDDSNLLNVLVDNVSALNDCCSVMQLESGDSEEMDLTPIVDILTSIDSRLHTLAEVDGVATDVNITQALIDNTESLEDIATRPIINTNEDLSPWSAV